MDAVSLKPALLGFAFPDAPMATPLVFPPEVAPLALVDRELFDPPAPSMLTLE